MTTYEHGMLGATLALALAGQKRHGWGIVAAAGVSAALPDWDGLSIVFGGAAYARVHRVWGHNLLVAAGTGLLTGLIGYLCYCSLPRRGQPRASAPGEPGVRRVSVGAATEWSITAILASLSHLPADVVYSGHPEMSSWPLQLLWPFSTHGWVWPLVAWGDVGTSLIFVIEMFVLYRWRRWTRVIAWGALVAVHLYVLGWWMAGGVRG